MKQTVLDILDDLKIKYRLVEHRAVYTIADLSALPNDITPVKNLLIQEEGGGRKFLVVIAGHARMDQKLIRDKFASKRLHFVDDAVLMSVLGVAPGSVSVFGLLNDVHGEVEVIVDATLMKCAEVGFHPNDNTATVIFTPNDLAHFLTKIGKQYAVMTLY